jgi:UDP-N-acetylmuramyl pentapeptide phosphotransferase/UDP-N-acetylglucosamine-1-phosphate transferase
MRRLFKRENILQAHKSHIYQRLNQSGWSHRRVAGSYVVLTLLIAALAATRG